MRGRMPLRGVHPVTRDEYDVADPGPAPAPDVERDPAPGPACPLCGGGPPVPTVIGLVCKSCARVLAAPVPTP
jgi:hypothetical protein